MSLNYTFYWILIATFLYINNFVNILLTSLRENTLIYNHAKIYKQFFFPDEKLMMSGLQQILFISSWLFRALQKNSRGCLTTQK